MADFIKGVDVSTLCDVEALGAKFYRSGEECDLFALMADYGINSVRLRIWNNPYDEEGNPYGGGTNDVERLIALAKRAKNAGMSICADFHYSDFWADPGKQTTPKAWTEMDINSLREAVYAFTRATLLRMIDEGVTPQYVQVGNEISNGMMWPLGHYDSADGLEQLIKSGVRAVREICPDARIILHVDNGGDNELCHRWFKRMQTAGVDWDIMGLSYYPMFHGNFDALEYNMRDLVSTFGKDLMLVETSYGFCLDKPADESGDTKPYMFDTRMKDVTGIEISPAGQAQFMQQLLERMALIPDGRACGFYYWEPAWIPVPGSTWAEKAGRDYVGDTGEGGNEWANQAMFDFSGNALPAWETIRDWQRK